MGKHQAYIIAGSNIEPRRLSIRKAISLLNESGITITKSSGIYESEPWGFQAELNFLNQAFLIETDINAHKLLEILLKTEENLGRRRDNSQSYSSRIIDLDILFFDHEVISTAKLQVPHPKMTERRFVLEPLYEIAPDYIHPQLNKSVHELLLECPDKGNIFRIKP
jgi:2-amino-4-hydroxy-6-hydroxymethyldihydropteridine diphosphokinase